MEKLARGYDMFSGGQIRLEEDPGKRLSKMIDIFAGFGRQSKRKFRWVLGEDALIEGLAKQMRRMYKLLKQLAPLSANPFNDSHGSTDFVLPLGDDLAQQNIDVDEDTDDEDGNNDSNDRTEDDRDDDTEQSNRDEEDTDGQTVIAFWWNEPKGRIAILELPDNGKDGASSSTRVFLYNSVRCHKIIFIFDPDASESLDQQLYDKILSWFRIVVSTPSHDHFRSPGLQQIISTDPMIQYTHNMASLLVVFEEILDDVLDNCSERVVVFVYGLDVNVHNAEDDAPKMTRWFLYGLQKLCARFDDGSQSMFKTLILRDGHQENMYDDLDEPKTLVFTAYTEHMTSLREELAEVLQSWSIS